MRRMFGPGLLLVLLMAAPATPAERPGCVGAWSCDEGQGKIVKSAAIAAPAADSIPGCVGAWSFDEGQGGTAKDTSPTGNHGTIQGAAWEAGKAGKALRLEGSACVEFAQGLHGWLGKTATLSCWIKTKQTGNATFWQAPALAGVEEAGGGNDIFWGFLDAGGHIALQAGDSGSVVSSTAVNDGRWHHVVLTRKTGDGAVQVYVDGKLEAEGASDGEEKTTAFKALGRRENTGGPPAYFQGMLDEVRLYNRVLTAEEVGILVGSGGGPIQNDGQLKGGAGWTAGKFGKAVTLDGSTGCIEFGRAPSEWMAKTASLACWIKTKQAGNDDPTQAPALAGFEDPGNDNRILWGFLDGSGRICMKAGVGEVAASETAVNDGAWHHVVLTRNARSGKVEVYVDGKQAVWASSEALDKVCTFNALGRRDAAGGAPLFFQGAIDDIKLYRRIVTAEEVQALFKNKG
jgi:hypothetical protein